MNVTSGYGWRICPFTGRPRFHRGIDLAAPHGAPVCAFRAGVVVRITAGGAPGIAVYVESVDGIEVAYCHLSGVAVRRGARVQRGDRLGAIGSTGASTGPHVHLTVRHYGRIIDPARVLYPFTARIA